MCQTAAQLIAGVLTLVAGRDHALAQSAASSTCVHFSRSRLPAGQPFSLPLPRNLEFRLIPISSRDDAPTQWTIEVGPGASREDYTIGIISPTRVNQIVGATFGSTHVGEALEGERDLRFVVTAQERSIASQVLEHWRQTAPAPEDRREILDRLGRGTLSLRIEAFKLREGIDDDRDLLDWITFVGDACVPAQ